MRSAILYCAPPLLAFFACADPERPARTADPAAVSQLYEQALAQVREGAFQAAEDSFDRLLQLDSTHYEALVGLGEVHLRQRRYQQALPPLERAYRADSERLEARFQLARTYLQVERLKEARHLLEALVADHPGLGQARMFLADLLMTQAPPDPPGALAQYEAILQTHPGQPRARAGAASARLYLGEFARAAQEMEALLRESPGDAHLPFLLGTAYYYMGQYERAALAYRRAVDVLPADALERPVRLWNLRLAYLAARGQYPGDLPPSHQLHPTSLARPSPVRFTDVAGALGVAKKDRGRGSAWGDYDGDGDLDLFSVGIHAVHALYRNDAPARFSDIARSAGLDDERGGWSATCADYDNDGDLDLYVTRDAWEGPAPNSLYQNQGGAAFREVSRAAGVEDGDDSFTAAWADYDGDGWIDLYVADGITGSGAANKLYHNQGDGTFAESAAQAGVARAGKSLGVAWGDYDRDGDPDLYVVDVGQPNTLYRNEGDGTFADRTAAAGVGNPRQGGYVAFFLDYDGDGDLDLFVSAMAYYEQFVHSQLSGRASSPARAHLYRNDGGERFADVGVEAGLGRAFGSMGAGFGDVDYDGLIDLYLANGGPLMGRLEPNILYHNRGDHFADITEAAGVGNLGKGHGATFADYDEDGDLDLYAGLGGHYPGDIWPNALYRNEGHANHWLAIDARGTTSNRSAIGAGVRLRAGDRVHYAETSSGGGFGSTNSLLLEFGLGAQERVDELEIRWPSGRRETHRDLQADRVVHLVEGP